MQFNVTVLCLCVSSADIDDLKICYILKDEINATSDVFSFTVEDNGKENAIYFISSFFRLLMV